MGTLNDEGIEECGVEPTNPSAQIESVRLKDCSGVAGQEAGDGVPDALADRVGLDQDELTNDFTPNERWWNSWRISLECGWRFHVRTDRPHPSR